MEAVRTPPPPPPPTDAAGCSSYFSSHYEVHVLGAPPRNPRPSTAPALVPAAAAAAAAAALRRQEGRRVAEEEELEGARQVRQADAQRRRLQLAERLVGQPPARPAGKGVSARPFRPCRVGGRARRKARGNFAGDENESFGFQIGWVCKREPRAVEALFLAVGPLARSITNYITWKKSKQFFSWR